MWTDDIRLPIYEALESGNVVFENFCTFYKDRVGAVLDKYSKLKQIILKMLASIEEDKIIVVESGYIGTIPMMLKAVDERVSFKLYTTAPFLYETYKDIIFCRRYEDIRKFETLYSQDLLLQYSSYHDEKFYVKLSDEKFVTERSLGEIKNFIY